MVQHAGLILPQDVLTVVEDVETLAALEVADADKISVVADASDELLGNQQELDLLLIGSEAHRSGMQLAFGRDHRSVAIDALHEVGQRLLRGGHAVLELHSPVHPVHAGGLLVACSRRRRIALLECDGGIQCLLVRQRLVISQITICIKLMPIDHRTA